MNASSAFPSQAEEPRRSVSASVIGKYRRRRAIGDAFIGRDQALAELDGVVVESAGRRAATEIIPAVIDAEEPTVVPSIKPGRHHLGSTEHLRVAEPAATVMPAADTAAPAWPAEAEVPEWTITDRIRRGHLDLVERACIAAVFTEYMAVDSRDLPRDLAVAFEQARQQLDIRNRAAAASAPAPLVSRGEFL